MLIPIIHHNYIAGYEADRHKLPSEIAVGDLADVNTAGIAAGQVLVEMVNKTTG